MNGDNHAIVSFLFLLDGKFSEYSNLLNVAVNILFSISSDSSSRTFKTHNDTMVKLTEVLKMVKISCKQRFP